MDRDILLGKKKRCSNCRAVKPIDNFWWIIKDVSRDSWCIDCQVKRKRIRNRERRLADPIFVQKEQDWNDRWRRTPRGLANARVRSERYRELTDNVHYIVAEAIKHGELVRGLCEVCGSTNVDAHHDDYSKPLDVRWLCRRHHRELSRKEG